MRQTLTRFRWQFLAIFAAALAVRLYGLNWDQGHFFHPDERRIAEAVHQLSLSPLQWNPHFFAYGSFPFYVTKLVTATLAVFGPWFSSYDAAVLTGRALSAFWGAATVAVLMLLGRRLYGDRAGLLAGVLLAGTVLHVQNSHFATNDVPLAFLVLLALYFMVRFVDSGRPGEIAAAGAAIGFAVATKFSALPLVFPLALAMLFRARRDARAGRGARLALLAGGCTALAFVLGEPYALLASRDYLHDIIEQSAMVRHAGLLPYTNQYIGVPKVFYEVQELVAWGMGPLLGVAAICGTLAVLRRPGRVAPAEWVLFAWFGPLLAITCSFDVKFLRYLLPLYPLLVLWAAAWLAAWAARSRWGALARGAVLGTSALYLLAFLAIYTRPHATVTASEWFYRHVPAGSRALSQDWDEGFPLPLPGKSGSRYAIVNFPYYDPDSPAKISRLAKEMASSDWVVFQTKRLYGAITRAPAKFPLTANAFYLLFSGDLGYALVKEFASRPSLFGIDLPDELADESFSVYDHPKALFFQNTGHLTASEIEARIRHGLPSRHLSRADLLLAHPGAAAEQPTGGEGVRSAWLATVLCAGLVELLGLAALALLRSVLPLRTGLVALAKVVGVVLFATLAWLAGSLHWLPFSQPALLALAALLLGAGFVAYRRLHGPALARREVITTEVVFWGTFAFFLALRTLNPEIYWGEKPMDFSFLNALYRTTSLPPPEPWFAGSALNYTYFGHFAVAALGKALAINPAVMFNLGIAVVAALTAASLFAAGSVLGGRVRVGLAAVALTMFTGNFSGVRELLARRAINFDYFWATSRVIHNTINEYPFWSFVFADLHAHVMAMPFAVAFVCLLLLWIGRHTQPESRRPRVASAALLALAALLLGAVTLTNGWSMPTYAAFLLAMLGIDWLAHRHREGVASVLRSGLGRLVVPAGVVIGGALAISAPFWRHFSPPARQWGREVGPFAHPSDYLTIFGVFLILLVPFFFAVWRRVLAGEDGTLSRGQRMALAAVAAALIMSCVDLSALASLTLRQAASIRVLAIGLATLGGYLALNRRTPEQYRLPIALAAFAFALTAGCELVFVWDRMNTVFKFYLEAWLLFGLAASLVLVEQARQLIKRRQVLLLWRTGVVGALAVGVFTSFSGAVGALRPRHVDGPRFTLDGMAYLARHAPSERAAFAWLNREIRGVPVLCEAHGPSYQEFSRVSMNTGLPIVLGWDYHVYQRGHPWREIDRRKADVETIYTAPDESKVSAALRRYHVALVFVGALERLVYNGGNLDNLRKWTDLVTPLYDNRAVTIFAVNGAFVGASPSSTVEEVPEAPARTAEPRPAAPPAQDPPGHLRQPRGLASDRAGNLYVCDFGNNRIQKFDRDLKPSAAWGRRGRGPGEFQDPCGVAVGPDGLVYVADTWNSRVQVFDSSGAYLREWNANFFGPRGIAVDSAGAVFVADTGNNRVVRFSARGDIEAAWGGLGSEPGKLREPVGVAVDRAGRVYVCDNSNGRLQIFTRDGGFVSAFPVSGWRREVFSEPFVAVDDRGSVWVTVPLTAEVRVYAADGKLLRGVRGEKAAPELLEVPVGLAISPRDGIPIVTIAAGRIVRVLPESGFSGK